MNWKKKERKKKRRLHIVIKCPEKRFGRQYRLRRDNSATIRRACREKSRKLRHFQCAGTTGRDGGARLLILDVFFSVRIYFLLVSFFSSFYLLNFFFFRKWSSKSPFTLSYAYCCGLCVAYRLCRTRSESVSAFNYFLHPSDSPFAKIDYIPETFYL